MRRTTIARLALILAFVAAAAVFASACSNSSGPDGEIFGIVTEVTGDLSGVESFVVLDEGGRSHKLIPSPGLDVMGQAPTHLRDHVVSGEPVTVIYHENAAGELVADQVLGEMAFDS